ncbi:glycosyltransferase family 9 protein [Porphyromonadaceae bacterium OttesenSCG-928-L07]|nr:glycosyltransferase family 9 protein [Porphyromonadaceae bacterium OttesenSCG-928-L07]MDL2251265.1 glycosyltransferase family 9 protein [Odoribacter sp. OttesenSCG-928-J03]
MKKLLVIRFSALGDVAMTIPLIQSLALRYPDLHITVLSRKAFAPLFEQLPANIHFITADLQGAHKGIKGLLRLFRSLKKQHFEYVADLHHVLRTRFLRICFQLHGVRTARIDKGRSEKRALTRKRCKVRKQLKTSFERYGEVFRRLGFDTGSEFTSIYENKQPDISPITTLAGEKMPQKWIGIAPFAKHNGKIYPLERMEEVVKTLHALNDTRIFLFGGGPKETAVLAGWEEKLPGVISLPGKLNMSGELLLMNMLDVMISMDSANMHLASLVHTPVISVWGATHPWSGFMGWKQSEKNAIQTDLLCRPCSVFGDKPCYRKDYACLNEIKPGDIVERVNELLQKNEC